MDKNYNKNSQGGKNDYPTLETNTSAPKDVAVNWEADQHLFFHNRIVSEYVPTRLAASILGISENALRIKVYRGQVPVHKLGRSLRFQVTEIIGLLKRRE